MVPVHLATIYPAGGPYCIVLYCIHVQDIPCLMVPVHLATIYPAGGPCWSATAIDKLKDAVIEHFSMFNVQV